MFSSLLSYQQGVDEVVSRILAYQAEPAYIVIIGGKSGAGKTHFARDIVAKTWLQKDAKYLEFSALRREEVACSSIDYLLVENHDADPRVVKVETQLSFQKDPDLWLYLTNDNLFRLPKFALNLLLQKYDFVIENPR